MIGPFYTSFISSDHNVALYFEHLITHFALLRHSKKGKKIKVRISIGASFRASLISVRAISMSKKREVDKNPSLPNSNSKSRPPTAFF